MSKGKAPSFQFYASDFLTDTSEYEAASVGAYIRLLSTQWVNGSLSNKKAKLARIAGVTADEFKAVWDEIGDKFYEKDGRYYNHKLVEVRLAREAWVLKSIEGGVNSAKKRGGKFQPPLGEWFEPKTEAKPNSSSSSSSSSSNSTSKTTIAVVFNFRKVLLDYGFKPNLVDDWIKIRKNKKATNTSTALENFITEIEKTGLDKNFVLKHMIVRSWAGLNANWMKDQKNEAGVPETPDMDWYERKDTSDYQRKEANRLWFKNGYRCIKKQTGQGTKVKWVKK